MKISARTLRSIRHFTNSHGPKRRLPVVPSVAIGADDQVSILASKPLHSFSLADLVRYAPRCHLSSRLLTASLQTWQAPPLHRSPLCLREFYSFPPPHPPRAPHQRPAQPALHRRLQPEYLPDLRQLPALSFHPTPLHRPQNQHAGRRGKLHCGPRRPRQLPPRHDPHTCPRLPRVSPLHQPR